MRKRTCVVDGRLRTESRRLRREYREFNKSYFGGKLPKNVFLFWSKKLYEKAYGQYYEASDYRLRFAAIAVWSGLKTGNTYPGTLLHEMIHVKIGYGHGRHFDRERKKLLRYREIREILL